MENWSKTLLESYRFLGDIVRTIDEMVEKMVNYSMFYNKKSNIDTMYQVNKVIELNDRKLILTNLKVIVDEGLIKLTEKELEVLSGYYIDCMSYEELADLLSVNIRTIFRRKKLAIDKFTNYLQTRFGEKYFLDNYVGEAWLMDLYNYHKNKVKSMEKLDLIEDSPFNNGKEIFKAIREIKKIAV